MSDRYSSNPLHLATVTDPPSLKSISCPIIFLSPAMTFTEESMICQRQSLRSKLKIGESQSLLTTIIKIRHPTRLLPNYGSINILRIHLSFPESPRIFLNLKAGEDPVAVVEVDESMEVSSIDVFYSQQGQIDGKKDNSQNTKNRFWHHATVSTKEGKWEARLPIFSVEKPLWAYANVQYKLKKQIVGAGTITEPSKRILSIFPHYQS